MATTSLKCLAYGCAVTDAEAGRLFVGHALHRSRHLLDVGTQPGRQVPEVGDDHAQQRVGRGVPKAVMHARESGGAKVGVRRQNLTSCSASSTTPTSIRSAGSCVKERMPGVCCKWRRWPARTPRARQIHRRTLRHAVNGQFHHRHMLSLDTSIGSTRPPRPSRARRERETSSRPPTRAGTATGGHPRAPWPTAPGPRSGGTPATSTSPRQNRRRRHGVPRSTDSERRR
jgi:hypothetical protein